MLVFSLCLSQACPCFLLRFFSSPAVYSSCLLATHNLTNAGLDTDSNPVFYINVADIPYISSLNCYIACEFLDRGNVCAFVQLTNAGLLAGILGRCYAYVTLPFVLPFLLFLHVIKTAFILEKCKFQKSCEMKCKREWIHRTQGSFSRDFCVVRNSI